MTSGSKRPKAKILYVEDDEALSFVTLDHLQLSGYEVKHAATGREGLRAYRFGNYDLCLLDVMLPEMDGFTLAELIRQKNTSIPILFLTAKSHKADRLKGFRKGGDDYLTKPYSIEELVMKIEVFLRRRDVRKPKQDDEPVLLGSITFSPADMTLTYDDQTEKQLTPKESEVLQYFCRHKDELIPRKHILEELWGKDDYFHGRSLDVFISKLRKYLKGEPQIEIQNVHGVGFKFVTKSD